MAKKKDNEEKKKTPATKNKGGRPRKVIDWEQLEKLCAMCETMGLISWSKAGIELLKNGELFKNPLDM